MVLGRRGIVKKFYANLGVKKPDKICQGEMDPFSGKGHLQNIGTWTSAQSTSSSKRA